ncbi:SDR family NAD(P)-dependent oxidoreductase [Xenorhabdus sp. Vera]|uniref:SDR family NAD(P)-dependent oxidoreductase n=1 Tax=Xenorhabdus koppenhoeferi TaxID=351659 RepID=UPI0019B8D5FC|nr:SDR family NAD(P)-dependent oxidoreductase [Xenorhabdus sp. Vera]MBD2809402.1 SDR family NAD(P)-dependent oxidoreductase [Xenorhabdus sp. Vera]
MQKVTIITGGSRGIGKATALCLAKRGHHVCIGYRSREEQANEVVDMIRALGQPAMAVQVDIADEKQVMMLFQRAEKELGYISGLVNNAGILSMIFRLIILNMWFQIHGFKCMILNT